MLLTSGLITAGTILHVFFISPSLFTASAHVCAILNGVAGITVMSATVELSGGFFCYLNSNIIHAICQ